MPITKWILPEGIEDILPEQAYWLEMKRREVVDTFLSYGYGLVIPPLIEYSDSLLNNISEDLNLQTFKLKNLFYWLVSKIFTNYFLLRLVHFIFTISCIKKLINIINCKIGHCSSCIFSCASKMR